MAIRIDFEPGDVCFACLVPKYLTPRTEEWCLDTKNRPLCGQCARDECVIHEPWNDGSPDDTPRRDHADLAAFGR
ncbi:MAG TPA: hypothetical protein VJ870_16045 [Amycolatopsis sp.]|nr:hypothetical protein [Amycolatopsis sp.]